MKLSEINTEFKTKRVITYNSTQTKALYHNKKIQHVIDNIYRGESSSDGYNEYCDIYMVYPEIPVGVWASSVRTDYSTNEIQEMVKRANIATAKDFESNIKERVKNFQHIRFTEIEMMKHICPEMESELWEARKIHAEKLEDDRRQREEKRKAEQEAYVLDRNRDAEEMERAAIKILKEGGKIENDSIEIYKDYYNSRAYSIINYLMRKYGVNVPIKTQGWINERLSSVSIGNGRCTSVSFFREKGGKVSQKFFDCMDELIQKVNN